MHDIVAKEDYVSTSLSSTDILVATKRSLNSLLCRMDGFVGPIALIIAIIKMPIPPTARRVAMFTRYDRKESVTQTHNAVEGQLLSLQASSAVSWLSVLENTGLPAYNFCTQPDPSHPTNSETNREPDFPSWIYSLYCCYGVSINDDDDIPPYNSRRAQAHSVLGYYS